MIRTAFLALALGSFYSPPAAALELAEIFGDHMVLQRDQPVPIWGRAEAGEEIEVSVQGKQARAVTAKDGRWTARLPALKEGGPFVLSVTGKTSALTLRDVLVGDVWLGSGQSNMVWSVGRSKDAEAEISKGDHPQIRFSMGPCPQNECSPVTAPWTICSTATVRDFSATAYYFGRRLQQELKVPIGLIVRPAGGTPTVNWISPDAEKDEGGPALFAIWRQGGKVPPRWGKHFEPSIAPLIPFALRGMIWDQGEAGPGIPGTSSDQMRALLVRSWRRLWGRDFPFIFVQYPKGGGWNKQGRLIALPEKVPENEWGLHSLEYFKESLSLPLTAMAVTFDLEAGVHPIDKQSYGERLGRAALAVAYGRKLVSMGPLLDSMTKQGSRLRLRFSNAEGGLTVLGLAQPRGFAVSGADGRFRWAEARVEGSEVLLWHPGIPQPASVRYGWAYIPKWTNLYNKEGYPLLPFRAALK